MAQESYYCNAPFDGDADIAGPGVLASYIGIAFITSFVATIPLIFRARDVCRRVFYDRYRNIRYTPTDVDNYILVQLSKAPLEPLTDVQLFTGLAIVIAGLSQLPEITYYHSELVIDFWMLTVNSFWAGEAQLSLDDEAYHHWRYRVRRLLTLCSVLLHVVFYGIQLFREQHHWNNDEPGKCYNSAGIMNMSWGFVWVFYSGEVVLLILLISKMIPILTFKVRDAGHGFKRLLRYLPKQVKKKFRAMREGGGGDPVARVLDFALWSFLTVIVWASLIFLSFLSYGTMPHLFIQVLFYWANFGIIVTYIAKLKILNKDLLSDPESKMGFGQILAVSAMGVVFVNVLDAWQKVQEDRRRKQQTNVESDAEELQPLSQE